MEAANAPVARIDVKSIAVKNFFIMIFSFTLMCFDLLKRKNCAFDHDLGGFAVKSLAFSVKRN